MAAGQREIRIYSRFEYDLSDGVAGIGKWSEPQLIDLADPFNNAPDPVSVPAGQTVTLWTASTAFPSFVNLALLTDEPLMLELVVDKDSTNKPMSLPLGADCMFNLKGDDAYTTYTTDSFAGVLSVINKIRVKNLSATTGAKLRAAVLRKAT
jgi:hypothetical protein